MMNPNDKRNADTFAKQSQDFIKAKNKRIRLMNRDIRMRNFLRTK